MNTSDMKTLVINVYKQYGVVLFEGVVQLILFPETYMHKILQIVLQCGTIRGCGKNWAYPLSARLNLTSTYLWSSYPCPRVD